MVTWLQHFRTYEQGERLIRPLNLRPPARIRPVAMYQRRYMRDRGLLDGLRSSAFGEVEGEYEERAGRGGAERG